MVILLIPAFFVIRSRINQANKKEAQNMTDYSYVSINETNQYQKYKQFARFIHEFPPEKLVYQGDIMKDGIIYYQYGNEDIKVEVISMDSYSQNNMRGTVDYTIFYRDKTFSFQEDVPQYPEDLIIYYVDINKDQTKDILLKGVPYSGTANAYYWLRAVDPIYMDEIKIFDNENHDGTVRLTDEQKKHLIIC